jgi:hypothetical protein
MKKVTLRLDDELHARLVREAEADQRSLHSLIVRLLSLADYAAYRAPESRHNAAKMPPFVPTPAVSIVTPAIPAVMPEEVSETISYSGGKKGKAEAGGKLLPRRVG